MVRKNTFKMPELPEAISSLLANEKVGYVSTISPKGLLSTYPVAYYFDGYSIYFLTPKDSAKLKFIRDNPSVSFSVDNKLLTQEALGAMFQGQAEIFDSQGIIGTIKIWLGPRLKYLKKYPKIASFYVTKIKELPDERKFYKYRLIRINPKKILYWEGYNWGRILCSNVKGLGLLSGICIEEEPKIDEKGAVKCLNLFDWITSSIKSYREGKTKGFADEVELEEMGDYYQLIQTVQEKALLNGVISNEEEQLLNILNNHYMTYETALNQALSDGKMTGEEFKMLEAIRNVIYVNAMNQALKDGKITDEENAILEAVKKEFRIKEE